MGSILDVLPHEGALFWGRSGALPLPDGRVLLVSPGAASIVDQAIEPPDNAIPAPDDGLPVRRPAYLAARPLFGVPAPAPEAPREAFGRLWPRRDEPDGYVRGDPYTGGMLRVAQALRAVQSKPLALSYRLDAGDPSDPEVAYQLRQAVQGVADAAAMFELPLLSGELRLEPGRGLDPALQVFAHPGGDPLPSPAEGAAIVLLGRMSGDLSGSLYVGDPDGFPPAIDLVVEGRVLELAWDAGGGTPLGRGGLLLTLARCCARARLGARVTLPDAWRSLTPAAVLFGEAQSRFLLFVPSAGLAELRRKAEPLGVPVEAIGTMGGSALTVDGIVNLDVRELH